MGLCRVEPFWSMGSAEGTAVPLAKPAAKACRGLGTCTIEQSPKFVANVRLSARCHAKHAGSKADHASVHNRLPP